MTTMISARRVTKHYADESGEHAVLRGVDLDVATGEWVAVTGRSGSGKSTLLHLLGGLDTPTSGSVEIAGQSVSSARQSARARLRRRHIGFVFQQYNLIDDLSAIGNVELALALAGVRARRRRAVAAEALDRLGLADRADASPSRLSGGEQQRVALARAVAARPDVVLADEPTGALDVVSAALVIDTLRQLAVDGRTIVLVTHDQQVAAAADRVVHMRDGVV